MFNIALISYQGVTSTNLPRLFWLPRYDPWHDDCWLFRHGTGVHGHHGTGSVAHISIWAVLKVDLATSKRRVAHSPRNFCVSVNFMCWNHCWNSEKMGYIEEKESKHTSMLLPSQVDTRALGNLGLRDCLPKKRNSLQESHPILTASHGLTDPISLKNKEHAPQTWFKVIKWLWINTY